MLAAALKVHVAPCHYKLCIYLGVALHCDKEIAKNKKDASKAQLLTTLLH